MSVTIPFRKITEPGTETDIQKSGELGIRTPGGCNTSTVFKTAAIDHSANSPAAKIHLKVKAQNFF